MISMTSTHSEIEKILKSIIGDISKEQFKNFIHQSWDKGQILFHLDKCFYSSIRFINNLDKDNRFETTPFYLPQQLPSTSTLLYTKDFAARLVHDSPDKKSSHIKFSDYNIEPHHHEVDSIIIATSTHELTCAEFMVHDKRLGFDTIIKIPFEFASVVCFPHFVNHTFMPSDIGLSTLNITDRYIQPHTSNFSHPSTCNFDEAIVMSYSDYKSILKKKFVK
jgi:hypothetical protein